MFSPSAIADFLACRHLGALNRAVSAGEINKPYFFSPSLDLLVRLGTQHEQRYLSSLRENPALNIAEISTEISRPEAIAKTIEAMRSGASVVYQAQLQEGIWYGRADFLRRVKKPSALGAWSYEVVEAKLARSTKVRAIIQLCFYSDLLSKIQGTLPERMHVVLGLGANPEELPVSRYMAYFRKVRREFEAAYQARAETYPEPVEHCAICSWRKACDKRWRADDHLSLVAGITRNQRKALTERAVNTVAALARLTLPARPKFKHIADQALLTVREQARLQIKGREENRCVSELLPAEEGRGLWSLPLPSPGDMFLDFEGDPYSFDTGLEYLFGVVTGTEGVQPVYSATWAINLAREKSAFENFIATVMERRVRYPDMHVYHYGAYEETALKRMAGRHAVCGDELDEFLRAEVLVDLYQVVRQGVRASVESYSIKKLEPLYGLKREVKLDEADSALHAFQAVLAFGSGEEDTREIRREIEGYNRDDCISTWRLRDWLEDRRRELEARIRESLPRPVPSTGAATASLSDYLQRVREVEGRLLAGIPDEESERTEDQKARWLLAQLLEWHRREGKSEWWKYFKLCELTDEELQQDKSALGGLSYHGVVGETRNSLIHRYSFPMQDHAIDRALAVHDPRTKSSAGTVVAIDEGNLTIDIKRGASSTTPHPAALIPHNFVTSEVLRDSLLQLGSWVAANGINASGPLQAARDLLLGRPPRLRGITLADLKADEAVAAAKQVALVLNNTVLPIQGPPGSGKTYTGARMIIELVRNGRKVGITAASHKVISNLLKAACNAAREAGIDLKVIQKGVDDCCDDAMVIAVNDNAAVGNSLRDGEAQLAAGTVWLWAREEMAGTVDVLFVDEAGQMSLANVLAASRAASSIVLLGDPQQLDQPQHGVHPPGAEASALGRLLGGRATIAEGLGIFLAKSWRLHPDICAFTSEVFYDNRLQPQPENALQRLNTAGCLDATGLRFVPVIHSGNQSVSPEEVAKILELVNELLLSRTTWTDKKGRTTPLRLEDILIVAPYNAQVSALARAITGARVGTVDKFQGQEAPVVFYSMASSTPEDAPRGMEFLYSSNRLNVATSRAQCVTVLVANPALFDVQCKTARQIELANAFCRYLELAEAQARIPKQVVR